MRSQAAGTTLITLLLCLFPPSLFGGDTDSVPVPKMIRLEVGEKGYFKILGGLPESYVWPRRGAPDRVRTQRRACAGRGPGAFRAAGGRHGQPRVRTLRIDHDRAAPHARRPRARRVRGCARGALRAVRLRRPPPARLAAARRRCAGRCRRSARPAGRRSVRTAYRPDPWRLPEWLTARSGALAAVTFVLTTGSADLLVGSRWPAPHAGLGRGAAGGRRTGALDPTASRRPPGRPGLPGGNGILGAPAPTRPPTPPGARP